MQYERLIEGDERLSSYYLTYARVQAKNVDPYKPMGPNLLNEQCWPVEVSNTQIGFSPIAPKEEL